MSLNALNQADRQRLHASSSNTADVELRIPPTTAGPKRTLVAKGRIWVTDSAVIFLADGESPSTNHPPRYDAPPSQELVLETLEIPYPHLLNTQFNLPIFAPNNLLISFLPLTNLPPVGRGGKIEAKFVVGEGAGHGLWKKVEAEKEGFKRRKEEEDTLPLYTAQGDSVLDVGPPARPPSP